MTLAVAALATLLVSFPAPDNAEGQAAEEYEVKAAFLYNFTKFVEWPPGAFPDDAAPIVIAVFGPDPFGPTLDDVVAGERAGGRPLVIRRVKNSTDLDGCHVIFVSPPKAEAFLSLVQSFSHLPMLTVGETDGFADLGGIIQFVVRQRKVRFRINIAAAERAGLKMSSRLLNLAEVVGKANH